MEGAEAQEASELIPYVKCGKISCDLVSFPGHLDEPGNEIPSC